MKIHNWEPAELLRFKIKIWKFTTLKIDYFSNKKLHNGLIMKLIVCKCWKYYFYTKLQEKAFTFNSFDTFWSYVDSYQFYIIFVLFHCLRSWKWRHIHQIYWHIDSLNSVENIATFFPHWQPHTPYFAVRYRSLPSIFNFVLNFRIYSHM